MRIPGASRICRPKRPVDMEEKFADFEQITRSPTSTIGAIGSHDRKSTCHHHDLLPPREMSAVARRISRLCFFSHSSIASSASS
jgi:hypothetical protein